MMFTLGVMRKIDRAEVISTGDGCGRSGEKCFLVPGINICPGDTTAK